MSTTTATRPSAPLDRAITLFPERFTVMLAERERDSETRCLLSQVVLDGAYADTRAWLEGFVSSRPEGEQSRLVSRLRSRRSFLPALIEAATGAALQSSAFAVTHEPSIAGRTQDFLVVGFPTTGAVIVEVTTVVPPGQPGGRNARVAPVSARQLWSHIRAKVLSYARLAEASDTALVVVVGTGPGELCASEFSSYLTTPWPWTGGVILESLRPELSAVGLINAFAAVPRLELVANPCARRPVPEALLDRNGLLRGKAGADSYAGGEADDKGQ